MKPVWSFADILTAGSVAVIGASDEPTRVAGKPVRFLKEGGFRGRIIPVNSRRDTVQGLRAYPDISAVDGSVDIAVVIVPEEDVQPTIEACAAKGVRAAIVFSAGFAEVGLDGKAREAALAAYARAQGMRILGPNSMGLFDAESGLYLTFAGALENELPRGGRVGIVSQSGGLAGHILMHAQLRRLRVGQLVSTGNECDIDLGEVMLAMAENPQLDVIAAYVEGSRSGERFIEALDAARRNRKPVVIMKVGRTEAGANAAISHTATLAGADAVYNSVFDEYGVHRVHTMDEMLDVVYAVTRVRAAGIARPGRRVGVLTTSGGIGAQIADFVDESGLTMAELPDGTRQALLAVQPLTITSNPVDVTGSGTANPPILADSLEVMIKSGACDQYLAFLGIAPLVPSIGAKLLQAMTGMGQKHPQALKVAVLSAPPAMELQYEEAGYLVFPEPYRAVTAMSALCNFQDSFDEAAAETATPPAPTKKLVAEGVPRGSLNEFDAKRLLADAGIGAPAERLVRTPEEAAKAATELGLPVAVKVCSAQIAHKTEAGGVVLNLHTTGEVEKAAREILQAVATHAPAADIDGLLVSKMAPTGVECVLGARRDPVFGPVVMFGLGGVMVELMKDVRFCVAPVTTTKALRMIHGTKGFPLLDGFRGKPRADLESLAAAIVTVSELMTSTPAFDTIEINPLLALSKGVLALDAFIELKA